MMDAAFHCVNFTFHLAPDFRYKITACNSQSYKHLSSIYRELIQNYLLKKKKEGICFLVNPQQTFSYISLVHIHSHAHP